MKRVLTIILIIFVSSNQQAFSQIIDSIHYDWTVYEYDEDSDNKKCYIAAFSKEGESSYTAPRSPYLSITHFSKTRLEEVSVNSGFEYKGNSGVYMFIKGEQYRLFTEGDMAWFKHDVNDKKMIQMMLETDYVSIRSDAAIGNYAVDKYSMKGFTRAYGRMRELCQ